VTARKKSGIMSFSIWSFGETPCPSLRKLGWDPRDIAKTAMETKKQNIGRDKGGNVERGKLIDLEADKGLQKPQPQLGKRVGVSHI